MVNSSDQVKLFGIRSVTAHFMFAVLSGILLWSAFFPLGFGWAAHVGLVPMVALAVRSSSVKRLFWTTYIVGVCWWLVILWWLVPVTGAGYFFLCLFFGLYTPVGLVGIRLLDRKVGLPLVVAVPMVWVSLEMVRGYCPAGGFGWYSLSHSQIPSGLDEGAGYLCQIADIFGHYGVGFVVGMSNGLILDLLVRPMFRHGGGGRKRLAPKVLFALVAWFCAFGGSIGYGVYRVNQEISGGEFVVGVVQTNIAQDNKMHGSVKQRRADWQRLLELTHEVAGGELRPGVIVWPETIAPAALNDEALEYYRTATTGARGNERVDEVITELVDELAVELIVGAQANYDWREVTVNGGTAKEEVWVTPSKHYNSAYLYRPSRGGEEGGKADQRYDKIHRVPFGEYIPWVENRPWLKKNFLRYLSPYGDYDYTLAVGEKLTVFELLAGKDGGDGGGRVVRAVTPICFEDTVSRVIRRLIYDVDGSKRADLILNLTNDGWFAGSWQRRVHMQIAVYRSIENRVPTARSVNTGVSGIIDSVGRVVEVVSNGGRFVDVEGVAVGGVMLDDRETVFGRFGYGLMGLMMICTSVLLIYGVIVRRKRG